jgi:O-antigen ligase
MGRGILNGLVALLLVGTLVSPYVGGAVTAYVLIGLSLLLIIWNLFRPPRFAVDAGSWMFVGAWALIAVAFMLTNRPGSSDYLLSVNFAMFALYPLLAGALQRFAGPNNSARIAILALAGSFVALVLGAVQVFVQHYGRAEGYASNPIPSATVALFLGFFALVGLFAIRSAWRYLFLLGPVAGLATVLLAGSRGPLVALPALGLIALIMLPIRRALSWGAAIAVVLVAGAAFLLKPEAFGRVATLPRMALDVLTGQPIAWDLDQSGSVRYAIFEGSFAAFLRSPWIGYGWYEKTTVVARYTPFNVGFGDPRVAHLHSDILNLGVSAGVVGLLAYVLVLLAPIVSAANSPRDSQYRGRLFLALTLSAGFLCCGAVNLLFGFEFMTTMYVCFAAVFIGYCRDQPALATA